MRDVAYIEKDKGNPQVEIIIGHAQFGKYQLLLWDKDGRNPEALGQGTNDDDVDDVFDLGDPASLHERCLSWEIIVASPGGGPGGLYSVIVLLRQEGKTVKGGMFQESGELKGTKFVFSSWRLGVS
ncbi:MAG: hypothetical protein SWQ30_02605 [Thermodesulfobacteriota bacterium]|nr:hypothetical protein [Thermodesulfobacteriota bacterium]